MVPGGGWYYSSAKPYYPYYTIYDIFHNTYILPMKTLSTMDSSFKPNTSDSLLYTYKQQTILVNFTDNHNL